MTQALFHRPRSVAEAIGLLADPRVTPLAGGTDYFAARVGLQPSGALLDLSAIPALRGIAQEPDGGWRIGAATTWREVVSAVLPPAFDSLKLAAREVGGAQVQNCGTVGGNLCNASPAADGVPPLLALDARVELRSTQGSRTLPLAEFVTGPRRTSRRAGELLTAVLVPGGSARGGSHFVKLGARRYLLISIAMVAARVESDAEGRIAAVRIVVGACSAVARRLTALEQRLHGLRSAELARIQLSDADLRELDPIDDVRATRAYRLDAVAALVPRVLQASVAA